VAKPRADDKFCPAAITGFLELLLAASLVGCVFVRRAPEIVLGALSLGVGTLYHFCHMEILPRFLYRKPTAKVSC
jgi:hypothetical protein